MNARTFERRFRLLIAAAWAVPPVFGVGFLVFVVELFSLAELWALVRTLPLPVFVISTQLLADLYFTRFAKPIIEYLEQPDDSDRESAALARARRFPLHFWGVFVLYLALAPVSVMWSAWLGYGFEPQVVDWFRIELVALVVSIIVGLPIFLMVVDLFGRAFTRVDLQRPQVRLTVKVFLIGALVPLLIDTMLVQYYWTETGYFSVTTFFVWLVLELLAIAGATLAARSFRQSLSPLDAVMQQRADPTKIDLSRLFPQSTDEIGVLASGYRKLLERLRHQNALLVSSNTLLSATQGAEGVQGLLVAVRKVVADAVPADDVAVVLHENGDLRVVLVGDHEFRREGHWTVERDDAPMVFDALDRAAGPMRYVLGDDRPPLAQLLGCRSVTVAPLGSDGGALGALLVIRHDRGGGADVADVDVLGRLAVEAAPLLVAAMADEQRTRAERRTLALEGQLAQAQRLEAVGRLAGGMAHDFNNLLTVIMGSASLLELDDLEPEQRVEIEAILLTSQRASNLTRQLLAFSRHQMVELVALDLGEVVEQVRDVLSRLVPGRDALTFELTESSCPVRADRVQLEQVLANLVVNAGDAAGVGGSVVLRTEVRDAKAGPDGAQARWVVLSVQDDGDGIRPDLMEHIFEPYFTTKPEGTGTGLGLATVYGIVSQLRGEVRVHTESGVGSTFEVYLPVDDADAASGDPVPAVAPGALAGRVLVVEDDAELGRILSTALTAAGMQVVAVETSGEAALAVAAATEALDLLVSDVVLPGINGVQVVDGAVARQPGLRVLLISGYAETDVVDEIGRRGIPFLGKPFTTAQLVARVGEVMGSGR